MKKYVQELNFQKNTIYFCFELSDLKSSENLIYCRLLGEAPIQIQAVAQKYREMPMSKTGIVELRLFKSS
jgi:hypothetical protein